MDNSYIEKIKKFRFGEVKTYVKDGWIYMEENFHDPYPGNFYICDYSFELLQYGWEHVCSEFYPDWTVHVTHRKFIHIPTKWEIFKSKITKLWKKS